MEEALRLLAVRLSFACLLVATIILVIRGEPLGLVLACLIAVLANAGWIAACARAATPTGWMIAGVHLSSAAVALGFPPALRSAAPFVAVATLPWAICAGSAALGLLGFPIHGLVQLVVTEILATWASHYSGHDLGAGALLAPWGIAVLCAAVGFLSRRGASVTREASAQLYRAQVERSLARARAASAAATDRLLHDTVLSTLAVIAHGGRGVAATELRARCRDDVQLLEAPTFPGVTTEEVGEFGELNDGLAALAERFRQHGLIVNVRTIGKGGGARPEVQRELVHAVQECLENVRRHAGVSSADVVVDVQAGMIRVVVVDEGCGFDPAVVDKTRLGLAESIHGRLVELGGKALVWSRSGHGTTVLLELPDGGPR